MPRPDVVVQSRRVVAPGIAGGLGPASVAIGAGRIQSIGPREARFDPVVPLVDVGDLVVMPGLVDTHVHVNEPGRTAWEGFESATRAAAAGGVTTLVDMPLNSIPSTTSVGALHAKRASAEGKLWVDVGFCGGLVPGNAHELAGLRRAGVLAFKCFMTDSGVAEFAAVGEAGLRAGMRALADLDAPLLVHAELEAPLADARARMPVDLDPRRYETWLASRPKLAEDEAVRLVARLARELHAAAHVVHVSSADALACLLDARNDGVRVSAETCPHYLHLCAEEIPDGRTEFKCAPPIREAANRELLWSSLRSGLIDQVVSDHSPCASELKRLNSGDFMAAWGGIASLQLSLAVVWTQARARGATLAELAAWMCTAPARLVGLAGRKGVLAPGADADLVIWDPDARFVVEPERLAHRHKLSPYAGSALHGAVHATWLRGAPVWQGGVWLGERRGRELAAR
jgi:allantoinase